MANYCAFSRTNYFRVTDEDRYKELFGWLVSEDDICDFTYKDDAGVTWHGFGAYGSIDCPIYTDEDGTVKHYPDITASERFDTEDDFDGFVNELKKILPDDEAFILTEVGYEKLRYVTGWTIVATKHKPTKCIDLRTSAVMAARELLYNDKWTTKMEY